MMTMGEVELQIAAQEQRMEGGRSLAGWRALCADEAPTDTLEYQSAEASCDPPRERTVEDLYDSLRWALLDFAGYADVSEEAKAEASTWLDALDRRQEKLKG